MEPGQELPPPSLLKRKIIIKNKKKHHHKKKEHKKKEPTPITESEEGTQENEDNGVTNQIAEGENGTSPDIVPQVETTDKDQQIGNGDISHPPMLQQRQSSKDSTQDDEG